jgi:hypothetical protein
VIERRAGGQPAAGFAAVLLGAAAGVEGVLLLDVVAEEPDEDDPVEDVVLEPAPLDAGVAPVDEVVVDRESLR